MTPLEVLSVTKEELLEKIISNKTLVTPRIIKAFEKVDRKDFVLPQDRERTYEDYPLSIGYEATISQPTTVAFTLEKLQPQKGDRILEIGTGSGYQTALLARLVGKDGTVYSVEYIPQLKDFAQFNLSKYNFKNIRLFVGDGKIGLADYAPFDRIVSSASGDRVPDEWKSQLKVGGIIVVPVGDTLAVLNKISKKKFKEEAYSGFLFVPLK